MTFRFIIENKDGKLRDYSDKELVRRMRKMVIAAARPGRVNPSKRNTMNKKKVVRNAKTGKFAAKSKAKTSPAKHVEETVEVKKPTKKGNLKGKDLALQTRRSTK